ncbi:MAG: hypothetical protein H6908_03550 [Hyphomicrobiales bacterium]|nr:hypothetical protein [Hyphomicrobiales bacterium]
MNVRTPERARRAGRYVYQVDQLVVELILGYVIGMNEFGDFILPVFQPFLVLDEFLLADFTVDPHVHQLLDLMLNFRMLLFQRGGVFLVMHLLAVVGRGNP